MANYKDTLNLPKTAFPMKAGLPKKEPLIQEKWQAMDIYNAIRKQRRGRPRFILHDGPPYANGNIHMGHVLNKVLKDIVVRYKTMRGYDAPFVPGWDCHGLPIEYQLLKEIGKTKQDVDKIKFRHQAHAYAKKYVDIQRAEFKRMGIFADWENPYLTMNPEYEASVIQSFTNLYTKGYIYKGLKPIFWCPQCETALADAEVEYKEQVSPAVFVRFRVKRGLPDILSGIDNISIVIWTTTPWTLPANLAVALRPEYTYAFIEKNDPHEVLIIAKQLVFSVTETIGITNYKIIAEVKGKELKSVITQHPFIDRESPVVFSEHVTLEQGTGCVHIAPGHGEDDFGVGIQYGLRIYAPVNEQGRFTQEVEHFSGMNVFDANSKIIEFMENNGQLLYAHKITHTYPYCWRCKEPIIFRATSQWFLGVDRGNLRQKVMKTIHNIPWIPATGEKRISSMVSERPDWCLSRQRLWGVPIPVFYCEQCGAEFISIEAIKKLQNIAVKEGSNAWFTKKVEELLPKGILCPKCGSKKFRKEKDILDVWFDSGISHEAVLAKRKGLDRPADLYLEGSDQHRGWFQSSLLTSIGMYGQAPFKAVLTHGFVVDGEGRKMSKSVGNVIMPQDILPKYGADILRLWVSSIDYTGDVPISEEILKGLSDAYRKLRNTFRFLLGNLYDFIPSKHSLPYKKLTELDRWMFGKVYKLFNKITDAYNQYQFYNVYHTIYNFCVVDLSAVYLDILKDRLYTFYADSLDRRSAQTVMFHTLNILLRIIAPILPFTSEEIWQYVPSEMKTEESVHLTTWLQMPKEGIDKSLDNLWDGQLMKVRSELLKVLEESRKNGIIGNSLEAEVILYLANPEIKTVLQEYKQMLPSLFITSGVQIKDYKANDIESSNSNPSDNILGLYISVRKAKGIKCARCWNYSETVGANTEYPDICDRCVEVLRKQKQDASC